ncbi:MAG: PepSY domain-containing protein [Frankiaceae bacterium]|nr:PepSY domain-containing protein [Frankiaceae bacterium]
MNIHKSVKRRNTAVVASLAVAAALAGVGVAAASGPGTPDKPTVSSQTEAADGVEGSEAADGVEEQEAADGVEEQEPALNGSVPVQEVAGQNEQQESARLASQATTTQQEAEQAALAAVPGTVSGSELGDENGSLVWEVTVTTVDGSQVEVKVDAGNGAVLAQEAEDQSGDDAQEAGEQSEGGSEDSGESDAGEATTG